MIPESLVQERASASHEVCLAGFVVPFRRKCLQRPAAPEGLGKSLSYQLTLRNFIFVLIIVVGFIYNVYCAY